MFLLHHHLLMQYAGLSIQDATPRRYGRAAARDTEVQERRAGDLRTAPAGPGPTRSRPTGASGSPGWPSGPARRFSARTRSGTRLLSSCWSPRCRSMISACCWATAKYKPRNAYRRDPLLSELYGDPAWEPDRGNNSPVLPPNP